MAAIVHGREVLTDARFNDSLGPASFLLDAVAPLFCYCSVSLGKILRLVA